MLKNTYVDRFAKLRHLNFNVMDLLSHHLVGSWSSGYRESLGETVACNDVLAPFDANLIDD